MLWIPPPCNVVESESALWLSSVRRLFSFPSRLFSMFTLRPCFLLTPEIPRRSLLRPPRKGVNVDSIPFRLASVPLRLLWCCSLLVLVCLCLCRICIRLVRRVRVSRDPVNDNRRRSFLDRVPVRVIRVVSCVPLLPTVL